jgi:hypothetical protein
LGRSADVFVSDVLADGDVTVVVAASLVDASLVVSSFFSV